MARKVDMVRQIDELLALAELSRADPDNDAKRQEVIRLLDTDAWPFKIAAGNDDLVIVRVDDARTAAQMLRSRSRAPYLPLVDTLITALGNLKRAIQ